MAYTVVMQRGRGHPSSIVWEELGRRKYDDLGTADEETRIAMGFITGARAEIRDAEGILYTIPTDEPIRTDMRHFMGYTSGGRAVLETD